VANTENPDPIRPGDLAASVFAPQEDSGCNVKS